VKCSDCDFIWSSKILTEEDLSAYYKGHFGSRRHLEGQIVNATVNLWVITMLINIKDVKSILDVGTGYGHLLSELSKQFALEATGIELSREEASYANSQLHINVINSSLGEADLNHSSYDLVTSFEVIEHVARPFEFLCEMSQYVKPNGHLIIMTDNFESRMAKSLGAGFPKWIPHSHISHFSPTTLKKAIEKTRVLTLVKSMSYTPWEIILRAAYYKLRGIRKTPSEAFNLTSELGTEMESRYKLFILRKLINRAWCKMSLGEGMDGDLMYFLLQKRS